MTRFKLFWFTLAALVLIHVPTTVSGQEAMVHRIDPRTSVLIHELLAAAGVSDDDPALRFMIVPPAKARPEATQNVNVKEGDLILMAAGSRVRSVDELRKVYESITPGEVFKLGLRRGDERFLVSFTRTDAQSGVTMHGGGGARVMTMQIGGGDADAIEVVAELGLVLSEEDGKVSVSGSLPLPHASDIPLAEGDVILAFGGKPVESLKQLLTAYGALKTGAHLSFTVRRDGAEHELELDKPHPVNIVRSAQ